MSIEVTLWHAAGETTAPAKLVLAAAVRRELPALGTLGALEWNYGTLKWAPKEGAKNIGSVACLEVLTWRLRRNLDVHQRAMGEWSFVGVGWLADRRVEFAGEYLRDFATGAFWEFNLVGME